MPSLTNPATRSTACLPVKVRLPAVLGDIVAFLRGIIDKSVTRYACRF
jgi:hypothetical protein